MKNIKIKFTKKKEKMYTILLIMGGTLAYAFIRGMFLAKEWYHVFGEGIMLLITILLLYYGYKSYQKREDIEWFDNEMEFTNLKSYKIIEVKNGKV